MAAGDLTTADTVRTYLRGSVSVVADDTALIDLLVTAVSKIFVSEVELPIITASATDTWSGNGGIQKMLNRFPVLSITSVTVDGALIPARPSIGSNGWVLTLPEAGIIDLVGYEFTEGVSNCVVVYSTGYGAVAPADIDQACVDQVAFMFKQKDRIGIATQSLQGTSVTYLGAWIAQQGSGGQTPLFAATIAKYRRVV